MALCSLWMGSKLMYVFFQGPGVDPAGWRSGAGLSPSHSHPWAGEERVPENQGLGLACRVIS